MGPGNHCQMSFILLTPSHEKGNLRAFQPVEKHWDFLLHSMPQRGHHCCGQLLDGVTLSPSWKSALCDVACSQFGQSCSYLLVHIIEIAVIANSYFVTVIFCAGWFTDHVAGNVDWFIHISTDFFEWPESVGLIANCMVAAYIWPAVSSTRWRVYDS